MINRYEVFWSPKSNFTYLDILKELVKPNDISIALNFESRVNNLVDNLRKYKHFCPKSKKSKLRKCLVHENISLIYRIVGNKEIELVEFIYNRSGHTY